MKQIAKLLTNVSFSKISSQKYDTNKSPDSDMDLIKNTLSFFDPIIFEHFDLGINKGIFLNNRALGLLGKWRKDTKLEEKVAEGLIKVYKEYGEYNALPNYEKKKLDELSIVEDLIHSAYILCSGRFAFHKIVDLQNILQELDVISGQELNKLTLEGLGIVPLTNLAEISFQTRDQGISLIGLQFLNIANKMASKISHRGLKSRINTLYGAYFLDIGDAESAEILLTDMSETPNQYDYTKYLNQMLLAMNKQGAGDTAGWKAITQRADHIKSVLNVSDYAEELGWIIFPPTFLNCSK